MRSEDCYPGCEVRDEVEKFSQKLEKIVSARHLSKRDSVNEFSGTRNSDSRDTANNAKKIIQDLEYCSGETQVQCNVGVSCCKVLLQEFILLVFSVPAPKLNSILVHLKTKIPPAFNRCELDPSYSFRGQETSTKFGSSKVSYNLTSPFFLAR